MNPDETIPPQTTAPKPEPEPQTDQHCPVCGATLLQEKCKVVCRSPTCTYRIIFNCAEF
jgi:hypothetical protein